MLCGKKIQLTAEDAEKNKKKRTQSRVAGIEKEKKNCVSLCDLNFLKKLCVLCGKKNDKKDCVSLCDLNF